MSELTKDQILSAVAEGSMAAEEASEHLAAMIPERMLSMKVSAKGGASLYGLQRFPITLYKNQWERVLNFTDEIRRFLTENDKTLRPKPKKATK